MKSSTELRYRQRAVRRALRNYCIILYTMQITQLDGASSLLIDENKRTQAVNMLLEAVTNAGHGQTALHLAHIV